MGKIVNFLDFSVDTQTHQLTQNNKRLDISSTAYKLLCCFIEHPGVTLTRKKLTDYVWENKIVSETSLDKLIQRLRKTLGDTATYKKIISTIHGEGFVFLPEVINDKNKIELTTSSQIKTKRYKFSAFVLLPILLLMYYANTDIDSTDNLPIISQAQANPMVLALIPNITGLVDKKQMWMTQGGMHYLKEKFNDVLGLELKNISLKKLTTISPERYAIDLTIKKQIDSSIIVSVKEENEQFISVVIIRNSDGILAQQSFTSTTIKSLYDAISLWAHKELKISVVEHDKTNAKTMSDDRFAVENYIRGISAQLSGDADKAIKYFELATNEDQKFWLAWYELSLAYRHQGNYQKSLSIIKVLENSYMSDKNQLMIKNAEALNYYYMGDYSKGIEILNQSMVIARESGNLKDLVTTLTNKSLFARNLGDQKLALTSITESIQVIKTLKGKNHSRLGSAYNTLVGIEINLYDYDSALKHALMAVENFDKSGNRRYQAIAKSRLSSIYYANGEWNKGEALTKEVLIIQKELNNTLGQTTNYMRLIDYDKLNGNFTSANNHLEVLSELMTGIGSKYQNDSYLITKIRLLLLTKQLDSVPALLNKLKNRTLNENRRITYHTLMLTYYKLKKNDARWNSFAQKFFTKYENNPSFQQEPIVQLLQAQLADKKFNQELAVSLYLQAQKLAIKQKNTTTLAEVFNAYIDYLLKNNKLDQAYKILLTAQQYNFPAYPFLKVKAQVLFKQGNIFKATALLEELKSKSGDLWDIDDQLLLERYKHQVSTNDTN